MTTQALREVLDLLAEAQSIPPAQGLTVGDRLIGIDNGVGRPFSDISGLAGGVDLRFGQALQDFGATFNGVTDDTAAIQSAINAMSADGFCNGPKQVLTFPPGVTTKIGAGNVGLVFDMSKVIVNGNGILFDAQGMASGAAITFTGSQASPGPYGQQCGGARDMHVLGFPISETMPDVNPEVDPIANVVGYNFDTPTVGAGTRAHYRGLYARGFGRGVNLARRTYLNTFLDCEISYSLVGWWMNNSEDAGESVTIIGGATYNGGTAFVSENLFGHFNLFGHSLDYNQKFVRLTNGANMFCTNANFETNSQSNDQIFVDGGGASFVFNSGKLHNVAATPGTFDCLINVGSDDHNCFVSIQDAWMKSWLGTTNRLAKGSGRVFIKEPEFYDGALATMPSVIGAGQFGNTHINDKMMDPSFESGTTATPTTHIIDDVFILADAGTPTDRFAGINGDIGISTAFARTSTKSLELKKKTAAGNTFKVAVAVPVTRRAAWGGECYVRGDGSVTGTYGITGNYALMKPLSTPMLNPFPTLTGLTPGTSFTQRVLGLAQIWYASQTHYVVVFDLTSLGVGSLFVDDLHISEW